MINVLHKNKKAKLKESAEVGVVRVGLNKMPFEQWLKEVWEWAMEGTGEEHFQHGEYLLKISWDRNMPGMFYKQKRASEARRTGSLLSSGVKELMGVIFGVW